MVSPGESLTLPVSFLAKCKAVRLEVTLGGNHHEDKKAVIKLVKEGEKETRFLMASVSK